MRTAHVAARVGRFVAFGVVLAVPAFMAGCDASGTPNGLAGEVAAKADTVAQRIGGANGFGGMAMNGYMSQMPNHMGFDSMGDLADSNGHMTVVCRNESNQDASFRMVYLSSPMGLADQMMDITVPAGSEQEVQIPCSEIVGLGSLIAVGETAAETADGAQLDNRMCVPGFLGADFQCSDSYRCFLAPDVNDFDGDGNTAELIVSTEALQSRMNVPGMGMGGSSSMMKGSTQP
jgi:hypothetical protein